MRLDNARGDLVEPEFRHAGEDAPFFRDAVLEDHVKRRDAVGRNKEERSRILALGELRVVHVAHLAARDKRQRQVRLRDRGHGQFRETSTILRLDIGLRHALVEELAPLLLREGRGDGRLYDAVPERGRRDVNAVLASDFDLGEQSDVRST